MPRRTSPFRLKDVSIRAKLTVSTLLLTVIMVVIGLMGIWGMSQIQSNIDTTTAQQIAKLRTISAMRLDYELVSSTVYQGTLLVDPARQE